MGKIKWRKSDHFIVCAGQRIGQEGLSPSSARVRGAVSKSRSNVLLARVGVLVLEDRVSTVRWNPKGLRRNTGP